MIIKKAEIIRLVMGLNKPFITSFGEIKKREIVLVKLFDKSGKYGIGEAPVLSVPLYNPETPDTVTSVLKKVLLPAVINKNINHPDDSEKMFFPIKGNEFAKSAINTALYDLFGKINNKKVSELIKAKKKKLLISKTISIHETEESCLSEAESYVKEGVSYLKLKVKPGFDVDFAGAILKSFPDIKLMLDANSAYVLNENTENIFKLLDKLNLYCIEQPLQSNDIIDHAKLQKLIKTPIALDESIESLYHIEKALEIGSCRLINIKIPRVGGFTTALKINSYAKSKGVKTWVGGMLESPVGLYANITLAMADNFDYPIDFLGATTYMTDYFKYFNSKPFEIKSNYLYPKMSNSGFSADINWKFLERNYKKVTNIK